MTPLPKPLLRSRAGPGAGRLLACRRAPMRWCWPELARTTGGRDILHVARDGQRLERLDDCVSLRRPRGAGLSGLGLPALRPPVAASRHRGRAPGDAGSPRRAAVSPALRLGHLGLGRRGAAEGAAAQPLCRSSRRAPAAADGRCCLADPVFLGENGYGRSETVMEPGEYAVRGGLSTSIPARHHASRCVSTCLAMRWRRSARLIDEPAHHRVRAHESSCCR